MQASITSAAVLALGLVVWIATMAVGVLLWRRQALGYPLAMTMLVLGIFIVGLSMPAATVAQLLPGYQFQAMQIAVFIGPFLVLGVIALWLAVRFLRNVATFPRRD